MPRPATKLKLTHTELLRRIEEGEWKVGERIPSTKELSMELDCSVGMVGKAIAMLAHDGLVEQRTKTGTKVIGLPGEQNQPAVHLNAYACIYPSDVHEGVWRTVCEFQKAADETGRRVVTISTGSDYEKEAECLSRLTEFDVQGAIMHPVLISQEEHVRFSNLLLACPFPVVLIGTSISGLECAAVLTDGLDAGYTMTRHLLDRGITRIGFFCDHACDMAVRDRYQGYRWAMKEAGVPVDPSWVYQEPSMKPNMYDPVSEPARMAAEYLYQAEGVQGVVCAHDFLAMGMVMAARRKGLRVPEDLKITGVDGHRAADSGDMAITTYRIPEGATGRCAFALLDKIVCGVPIASREVLVKGELVVRKTT